MSLLDYTKSKASVLIIAACSIAFTCVVATVCGCPTDAVILIAAALVCCLMCCGAVDFLRSQRFYNEARDLAEKLEHPYQMHSLMSKPLSPDHAIVYDALKTMGSVSAEEVAQANAKADEHREFVEGWVHGVKAPLASCGLIAERVAEPERSQLNSELDRIGRKVDAALWYARSDCATRDYAIHEVELAEIPRKVCRENARFLIEQGCTPIIDIDPRIKVFTDIKQATFIVTQLAENAAKYGARSLKFTAEKADPDAGIKQVVLRVEDDGRGIPAADVNRVFERGFTGERGREKTASTGMGLYLAARLCEQLGLGLSISSIDGKGTCATLTFPLDERSFDIQSDKSVRLA